MTPIDALWKAISYTLVSSFGPSGGPGYLIKRLPKELRAKLEELKSDDTRKMRYP